MFALLLTADHTWLYSDWESRGRLFSNEHYFHIHKRAVVSDLSTLDRSEVAPRERGWEITRSHTCQSTYEEHLIITQKRPEEESETMGW